MPLLPRLLLVASLAVGGCATAGAPAPLESTRLGRPQGAASVELLNVDELQQTTHRETFNALRLIADPIEPFNRFSLRVTKAAVDWVVVPVAKAYRFAVPTPARSALERFSYNLTYPGRFVSLVLEGEIEKSAEETAHFLTNSTLGLAGLFDPATGFGLRSYPEDPGQAFATWGIGQGFYIFLPFYGPSSARDAVGEAVDLALNPLVWIPAPGVREVPFLNVVSGGSLVLGVNSFSFRIDGYESLKAAFPDLYEPTRALWSLQRRIQVENYRIPEADFRTADPEPSLGVLLFELDDPDFANRARERSVRVPATGRHLPYSAWLQPHPAPVLFLLPGVGAHRLSGIPVGLAEAAYARGYSVVTISSPFHPEFIRNALTVAYPGYTPHDARDVYAVLDLIWRDLQPEFGNRFTDAQLLGYSLGGIETLAIAASQHDEIADGLRFRRFVAINPPVDLLYAGRQFDAYFDAPLRWPTEERSERIRKVAMKAFLLFSEGLPPGKPPPFDRTESEFLVGFAGRATLTDAVATTRRLGAPGQRRAVDTEDRSDALAKAILRNSFEAYFEDLAFPYFQQLTGNDMDPDAMARSAGLYPYEAKLHDRRDTFVITNADDFILGEQGLDWLRRVFGERLTVFPAGGHLGNIRQPAVQNAIFADLAAPDGTPKSRPAADPQ